MRDHFGVMDGADDGAHEGEQTYARHDGAHVQHDGSAQNQGTQDWDELGPE
jgi:hypothetical protein